MTTMFRKLAFPFLLLALASVAQAGDVTLTATITPTATLKYAYLGLYLDASSVVSPGFLGLDFIPIADGTTILPGGVATPVSQTFSNYFDLPVLGYTLLGLYDTGSGLSASLGVAPSVAPGLIGHDWPYADPNGEDRYLDNFFTFTGSVNPDTLNVYAHAVYDHGHAAALGSDLSIVNFSQGTDGGSVSNIHLTPVPEPSAFVALGVGALALRRRRRSA